MSHRAGYLVEECGILHRHVGRNENFSDHVVELLLPFVEMKLSDSIFQRPSSSLSMSQS